MKNITKISLIIGIILTLFLIYYLYLRDLNEENEDKIEYSENVEIIEDENDNKDTLIEDTVKQETEKLPDEQIKPEKEKPLPTSKKLEAAFIPQAPYHDWSEPWQNACEEAALLTLHHYILGDKEVSPEQVKQEILNMLSWQDKYFGSHKDLNMAEVAEMAENYLGHKNVKVTYEIKIEDIKKEVASGNPVLIPAAGRVLNNPNFTPPGPVYHNLVVIGYTENKIITNDPGTRLGANFEYDYDNFYDSIHDYVDGANYNNADKMLEGKKTMIVIEK